MARYYLDTSALVKLYVQETGTDRMVQLIAAGVHHQLALLASTKTEFHSAFRRRERQGDLDSSVAAEILDEFDQHLLAGFLRQGVSDIVIDLASLLLGRHALRAFDALQLAGYLVLRSGAEPDFVFVCSDRPLLKAASEEGLECFDPTA